MKISRFIEDGHAISKVVNGIAAALVAAMTAIFYEHFGTADYLGSCCDTDPHIPIFGAVELLIKASELLKNSARNNRRRKRYRAAIQQIMKLQNRFCKNRAESLPCLVIEDAAPRMEKPCVRFRLE